MSESQYRFAEFQLDCASFELRRQGRAQKSERISLERIPMELLILLLERQGSVVTREEIIDRLWGKDVFVDTEHGINTAIRKVRQALRDDPERPRFVQTVTGKGYRFIAERSSTNGRSAIAAPATEAVVPPQPPATFAAEIAPAPKPRFRLAAVTALIFLVVAGILIAVNAGRMRARLFPSTQASQIHSIAVLPLSNLSGDSSQDYFADGMTDELITELAQIRALRVISRTSIMQYKGTHKSVPEIARELRVDAILEGSVQRSGDRVRITAQLIEGSVDRHLWAKSFDRDLRDVLSLQGEVARSIADEIQVSLNPEEQARLAQSRPIDPAAHEAYLKGRYNWNKFTDEGMQKAVGDFQQAIAIDPKYAVAYVGLADAYHEIGIDMMAPAEAMRMAKAAAMKALELDPSLSDAHATLGWIKWRWDWDWSGAEQEFKNAIALDANNSKAPAMYANFLDSAGRFDEAMLQHRRAVELDPLSLIYNTNIGDSLAAARRYDEAIRQYKKTLEIDPGFVEAHFGLAGIYEHKGMYKEAVSELQQGMVLNGDKDSATVAHAFATSGWKGVLQSQLQSFKVRRAHGYFPSAEIAGLYADLGERDLALQWLKRAYEERDGGVVLLNEDPAWDALRSDARFQDLARKVGLPPEPASHANQ
jgi:TolB-like protein/DNA-binding winged helix-turn-helix (wHTH) protein/Tfp pilus assembly protein PilF